MMLSKVMHNKLVTKANAADIKIPSTTGVVLILYLVLLESWLKHSMNQTDKVLRRILMILTKRHLILMDWLKRPITTQNYRYWKQHFVTGLVTTTGPSLKAADVENKILDVTNLTANAACSTKTAEI